LTESRSLILSQMCASKFSCFLMSDRLLGRDKKCASFEFLVGQPNASGSEENQSLYGAVLSRGEAPSPESGPKK